MPGQQLVDDLRVAGHPSGGPARGPDDHHLDRRLRGSDGIPQAWLPIRRFATFYVTGWDSNIKPQCAGNEGYPGKHKNNSDNGAVWGHWINYDDTAGTPNGQACVLSTSPTNCVPALTR